MNPKLSLLGLALLGLSSAALADAATVPISIPSATNLIAPSSHGTWVIGIEGMYVGTGNGPVYAQQEKLVDDVKVNGTNLTENPGFQWGGTVNLSYIFPQDSRDISLAYTYLNSSANHNLSQPFANNILYIPPGIILADTPPAFIAQKVVSNQFSQQLNAVDLTTGQQIQIKPRVMLHPFAGLRYAEMNLSNHSRFYNNIIEEAPILTYNTQNTSQFNGVGPRIGSDINIQINYGISVLATLGASLLIGNLSSNGEATQSFSNIDNHFSVPNHTQIVPEVDGKIGLAYTHNFAKFGFNIQAGYEMTDYFNALNAAPFNATSLNSLSTLNNFMYQGPYAKLQISL